MTVEQFNSTLLFEPGTILNGQQLPYRVFTPFWRTVEKQLAMLPAPERAPRKLPAVKRSLTSVPIRELSLLPEIRWDDGLAESWTPGESGALKQHFGEIGPRQLVAALRTQSNSGDSYLRQVGWREFAHHLLFHFPATTDKPIDTRFAKQRWQRSRAQLKAWQRGATGIPLVDAGMRELLRRRSSLLPNLQSCAACEAVRSTAPLHPSLGAGDRTLAGSLDS